MKQKLSLKKLIESELQSILNESIVEPSEQVLKAVQAELKAQTGINIALSKAAQRKSSPNIISYTADLAREIRTPVMNSLFQTLVLNASCSEIPNSIGGYSFEISIDYTHPQGGSNGITLGNIFYTNGKVTSRFR
jgi:hypothetical protein